MMSNKKPKNQGEKKKNNLECDFNASKGSNYPPAHTHTDTTRNRKTTVWETRFALLILEKMDGQMNGHVFIIQSPQPGSPQKSLFLFESFQVFSITLTKTIRERVRDTNRERSF